MLEKKIPGNRTILPDSERLFQMLDHGRLDTVTEHSIIADYYIQQLQFANIKKISPALVSIPGYSLIHKKHQALIPAITKSLSEMKADGSFEKIKADVFRQLITP